MNEVWVSFPLLSQGFLAPVHSDIRLADLKHAGTIARLYDDGVLLDAAQLPGAFFGKYRDKPVGTLPDFFLAGGYYCVSAACAGLLGQFQLGSGTLFPVPFFDYDRATAVEGSFFLLANLERKEVLNPGHSIGVRRTYQGYDIWSPPVGAKKDGQVAVNDIDQVNADLWIDPRLQLSLFFRGELVHAMRADGLKVFPLMRCTVVAAG